MVKNAAALWEAYRKEHPEAPDTYVSWAFGDSKEMADELAQLVLEGVKTATASNYALYELEKEPLPAPGLINVIEDGSGNAVAVAKTTEVRVVPFEEVTEAHAYLEGEGDRSLKYWRAVHEPFFQKEMEAIGQNFSRQMLVVCEYFEVVHV